MKKLEECKEYYKDLYFNCLESNAFDKNIFDSTDLARYEMFCETLKFAPKREIRRRALNPADRLNG